ncbi:MAG TPA: hypothetical protein VM684_17230, partial [Gaiellales bacterium]|nr:hypothetical protein [Gaiellales bacterium]
HRLLDHYLHTSHAASGQHHPEGLDINLPPPIEGSAPEPVPTAERAEAWFAAERSALLGAVEQAAGTGFDRHARQLARLLSPAEPRRALARPSPVNS